MEKFVIGEHEKFTAYITKYALTSGIIEVQAEFCSAVSDEDVILYKTDQSRFNKIASGKDWHRTKEEAIARAEEMRLKKIAAMNKKLVKLENMKF